MLSRWLVNLFRMLARLHFRLTTTMQYAGAAEGGSCMCQGCGISYDHIASMAFSLFQLHSFGRINSSNSSKAACFLTRTFHVRTGCARAFHGSAPWL